MTQPEISGLLECTKLFDKYSDGELLQKQQDVSPVHIHAISFPPPLIMHCRQDSVVDFKQALHLEKMWNKAGGELQTYYYKGHSEDGHNIWRKDTSPPKLHRKLEEQILTFLTIIQDNITYEDHKD